MLYKINLNNKINIILEKKYIYIYNKDYIIKHRNNNITKINLKEEKLIISTSQKEKKYKSMINTTYKLLTNYINGIINKYNKKLIIHGIGFKCLKENDLLKFYLGFSHKIFINIPNNILIKINNNEISIIGISKCNIGLYSAKIKKIKKINSYKLKGIKYHDEKIILKSPKKKSNK